MSVETVLIGFVLICLVAAVAAKEWEKYSLKQYQTELSFRKRKIFRRREK